jgi:DNA helicase II / ATP-dependent DNA helicase PcrA
LSRTTPNTYFIGAGDIDQVIHSRLGASDVFMRSRFAAAFPGTVSYPLTFSFRHGPHLALAAGAFKQKASDSLLPLHTEIYQRHYDAEGSSCADQVIASVKRWTAAGHAIDDCTILVREPHQAIAIENALMRANMPYRTLEMPRYLDREEILFLRGMIAIALDNFASTDKTKRGAIFDAVATFAEVSFGAGENVAQLRQAVIDEPVALTWLFTGRVDQRKSVDVRDRVVGMADQLIRAQRSEPADLVLGTLRQQLSSLHSYVQGDTGGADGTLKRALAEVEQAVAAMVAYLEHGVASMDPRDLLDQLRNLFLTLVSTLDQLVAGDVKQRMSGVIGYMQKVDAGTPAHEILKHICARMDVEALAKRLYVHPHEARVVSRSIAGFIKAAEHMQMNLRQFSEWIANADMYGSGRRTKGCVQLDCVRNAKGKEFRHVILPFMEVGEFPFARADLREEDNLFYVAITRAIAALTLISPTEHGLRSPFLARLQLDASKARADTAITRNASRATAPSRTEFRTSPGDWARARELGAHWDSTRKVFYLMAGQSPHTFAEWLNDQR